MARNRSGRNRNRRRNGGNSSLYARPIIEPCNFVELDVTLDTSTDSGLALADVYSRLTTLVTASNIGKFRVSSVVVDQPTLKPGTNIAGGAITNLDLTMGISGNHYQWSNLQKPLKVRFGKEVGDDGQWIITNGASTIPTAAIPGGIAATALPWITIEKVADVDLVTEIHLRIAFTDIGSL